MWHCKRKRHLIKHLIQNKKKKIPSVYSSNAEEILDAGIIKSTSRPANPRPDAEEILDAGIIKSASRPTNPRQGERNARIKSAFCKPRLTKKFLILSAWTQVPDSSKSAADGTERKDQIRVLQTKTAPEPFTIRNI